MPFASGMRCIFYERLMAILQRGEDTAGNPCKVIRKIKSSDDEKYKHGFPGFSI